MLPPSTEALRAWKASPPRFVREVFGITPDPWQDELLAVFPQQPRIAMQAAKGPGKTAILAWLAWNFLLTRPHPKVAATSISADNLADNLWTEMAFWRNKSPMLQEAFEWTKTRIFARDHPETWWMAARSWSKSADRNQQALTLAGLHADYVLFLLDESGGIPDSVMVSADAALSSCKEGHIVQAGNPTHLEGPLYRAATSERKLWHIVQITGDPDDPKRASRIKVDWARDQIAKWGKDNPYVLVNVFGRFPPSSLNTLIGPDEVRDATLREYHEADYAHAAKILGVDVARFGDDASVIFPRQGLVAFTPIHLRNLDGTQGAGLLARKWQDWDADACFCDDTGGYGASWIDNLIRLGHSPIGIGFAQKPYDARYANKRAEMYFSMIEWIRRGGRLPPGLPELTAALTQTTYTFQNDKMLLEPKEDVKTRIGYSPDHADALALTFAAPVVARHQGVPGRQSVSIEADYNPLAAAYGAGKPGPQRVNWGGMGGWNR